MLNSRQTRFSAPRRSGDPFSRSYGVILPSSLTTVISSTLGYSPHLPVSVYGTDTSSPSIEAFLGSTFRVSLWAKPSHSHLGVKEKWIYQPLPPTCLDQDVQHLAGLSLLRPPIGQTDYRWYGNIRPFSIAYALRPRLRVRLTLSRLALLRKP